MTDSIQTLETWEGIRLRPDFYIGDRLSPKAPLELLTQAVQRSRTTAKTIGVDFYAKGIAGLMSDRIRIIDDSPGWDITLDKFGMRKAERLLRELTAPDNGGLAVVNALSSTFEFTTWTDGRAWSQRFVEGKPVSAFTDNGPCGATHGIQLFFSLDPKLLEFTLPRMSDAQTLLSELRSLGIHVDLKVFSHA